MATPATLVLREAGDLEGAAGAYPVYPALPH
jgi:hypothetical protein